MTAELKPDKAIGYLHEVHRPVVVIRCERMPPFASVAMNNIHGSMHPLHEVRGARDILPVGIR
jgi:hypothetical protein